MAQHASAIKAARQAERRKKQNQAGRAKLRTAMKSLRTALAEKTASKEEAKKKLLPLLSETQRVLMKAGSKNLIKKQTASRYVSRLSEAVHRAIS